MVKLFSDQLEILKKAGIDFNMEWIDKIYKQMMSYQTDKENPDLPLWIIVRGFGYKYLDFNKKELFHFSKDVSTIVCEEYFINYDKKGIVHILDDLKRISRDNIDIQFIEENKYDAEESHDITIVFKCNGEVHSLVHKWNEYADLSYVFVRDEILPRIKGSVTKGHLLYLTDGESFTFIYSEDAQKIQSIPIEKKVEIL